MTEMILAEIAENRENKAKSALRAQREMLRDDAIVKALQGILYELTEINASLKEGVKR